MHSGSVYYDGILYEDVPLRYDVVNDALLVRYLKDNNTIRLIKNKVLYFSILRHRFIRFNENEQNGSSDVSGFFELIYNDNKLLAFARRYKKLVLSSNPEDKSGSFVQYNEYFVYKEGKTFSVNSEHDLAEVFGDKAHAVKKFIRTGKIRLKKNPDQLIINTASFYKGLIK